MKVILRSKKYWAEPSKTLDNPFHCGTREDDNDDATMNPDGRLVRLVLVTSEGELLGTLPSFPVATPWWQNAWDIVQGAEKHHGIHVTVLRLLEAEHSYPGGSVTYLAEIDQKVETEPWNGQLDDHPLRLPWAKPGGPAVDLAWADSILSSRGTLRIGPAEQVRTWNLSSIWRLPLEKETVWLKVVPPFFKHEGPLLERLQGRKVPTLIAQSQGRLLLGHIPGDDLYDAPPQLLLKMISSLVNLHHEWISRTDELLALGLPDWRARSLAPALRGLVTVFNKQLSDEDRVSLSTFLEGLDKRFEEISHCELPDTLVHGDFFQGNHRGDATSLVLLDWGDSGLGHPLLDETTFLERIPAKDRSDILRHWHNEWKPRIPGSDPDRASRLLAPIGAARHALIYQRFLENIEPSEHVYHKDDPLYWLRRTASLARVNG